MVRASLHVAVLFDRIGPYHQARLAAAGQDMDVTAVEIAGESAVYDWKKVKERSAFERITIFEAGDSTAIPPGRQRDAIQGRLEDVQPDVVAIPGWSSVGALAALQWCNMRQVPSVVMSESAEHDFDRRWWRERIKAHLVSKFDVGLVGGTLHRAYLRELGMMEDNVFMGYDAVDNKHFAVGAREAQSNGRDTRRQYSLPDQYFLASGRFVPKKNFPRLIKAFAQYRKRESSEEREERWDLVLLGEGPERDAIEETIDTEDVRESVHLPGFKQYDELPSYYGLAGAFIHASTREQWGLVVNEAMAAALPVLVSDRCGCAPDLVDEGRNGFTFDPYDPSDLADHMYRIARGDADREKMGATSRDIIADWGPERFATGLRKAAETALNAGPPSFSLFDRLLASGLMYR